MVGSVKNIGNTSFVFGCAKAKNRHMHLASSLTRMPTGVTFAAGANTNADGMVSGLGNFFSDFAKSGYKFVVYGAAIPAILVLSGIFKSLGR